MATSRLIHVSPKAMETSKNILLKFDSTMASDIIKFERVNSSIMNKLQSVHRKLIAEVTAAEAAVKKALARICSCTKNEEEEVPRPCPCELAYQSALARLAQARQELAKFEQLFERYKRSLEQCTTVIRSQKFKVDHNRKAIPEINKKISYLEEYLRRVPCRNESYAGNRYLPSGVSYERRTTTIDDYEYEVVVPNFNSYFDVYLPSHLHAASDRVQFNYCLDELRCQIMADNSLASRFSPTQMQRITNNNMFGGSTPLGFVWHHGEQPGLMQLVDAGAHQNTPHTGGRYLWGGGRISR